MCVHIERNWTSSNSSIFLTTNVRYIVSQIPDAFAPTFGSTCDAAARTTPRDREKSLSFAPAIQSTLCTRRDNNLLTRTCRLRKEEWRGTERDENRFELWMRISFASCLITGVERKKSGASVVGHNVDGAFRRDANTLVAHLPSACLEWDPRPCRSAMIRIKKGLIIAKYDGNIFHIPSTEYSERISANKI